MKRGVFMFSILAISGLVMAQTDSVATGSDGGSSMNIGGIITGIVLFCGALYIIGHMLYVLFKAKKFNTYFSVEGFRSKRQETGKPADSTLEENEQCQALLDQAFLTWTNVEPAGDGMEYRKPKRMKEIVASAKFLADVIELEPTNAELVKTLNEYKEVVRTNEQRSFDGSWKLVILGMVIAVLAGLIGKTGTHGFFFSFLTVGAFFWVPVVVYYISSLTPQFLIEKRANRGGGNISTGLVAIVLGVLGSGYTVRTHYTDGTHEDDHSGHMIALFLGILVAVLVALTISFWAVFNYLRNYVLYF